MSHDPDNSFVLKSAYGNVLSLGGGSPVLRFGIPTGSGMSGMSGYG